MSTKTYSYKTDAASAKIRKAIFDLDQKLNGISFYGTIGEWGKYGDPWDPKNEEAWDSAFRTTANEHYAESHPEVCRLANRLFGGVDDDSTLNVMDIRMEGEAVQEEALGIAAYFAIKKYGSVNQGTERFENYVKRGLKDIAKFGPLRGPMETLKNS